MAETSTTRPVVPTQPTTIRPALPLQQITADMKRDVRLEQACGLMQDAFRQAVTMAYGTFASGAEERECQRRLESVMSNYFTAKRSPSEAVSYIAPDTLARLIETITIADPIAAAESEQAKHEVKSDPAP